MKITRLAYRKSQRLPAQRLRRSVGGRRLIPEFYAGVLLFRLRRASGFATQPRIVGLASLGVFALGIVTRDVVTVIGLGMLIFALSSDADFLAPWLALRPMVNRRRRQRHDLISNSIFPTPSIVPRTTPGPLAR
ncbi:MAG: hypothetical protein ACTHKH_18710 [Trinickia sp.]